LENETQDTSAQDEQAAFAAGFDGEAQTEAAPPNPEPAKQPEAKPDAEAEPEPAPTTEQQPDAKAPAPLSAEEIESVRAAVKDMPSLREQLRKVEGRVGSATDMLTRLQEQRRTDGQPATMTALELKKTREAYPELADVIGPDIEATLKALRVAGPDPEEVTRIVNQRLAEELKARDEADTARLREERRDAVREVHEDFDRVIVSDEFREWKKNQPQETQDAINTSPKVSVITKVITQFKTDKANAAKKAAERKNRLESAITPEGERRGTGKPQLSDQDAMNAGFLEGFNT